MELSKVQTDAVDAAGGWLDRWRSSPETRGTATQIHRLFGYAGTGKTTIATEFANLTGGRVLFASYTGKAAHVMRDKGCTDATTLHSLIYRSKNKSESALHELREKLKNGHIREAPAEVIREYERRIEVEEENLRRPRFKLNSESELRDADLLVIDECSMVGDEMAQDILSFNVPILVLGDPAQLPPVRGTGYFTAAQPDTMLEEVHRHAQESVIYRLATLVRENKGVPYGARDGSCVAQRKDLDDEALLATHQILVGTHRERHSLNDRMRHLLDRRGDEPEQGDRVICTRNNHDLGIYNGSIWELADEPEVDPGTDTVLLTIEDETCSCRETVDAHLQPFLGGKAPAIWSERKEAEEFEYGYAMTVHKSQGSQWQDVLVIDESGTFERMQRGSGRRWLYTAVTRASERIRLYR